MCLKLNIPLPLHRIESIMMRLHVGQNRPSMHRVYESHILKCELKNKIYVTLAVKSKELKNSGLYEQDLNPEERDASVELCKLGYQANW